MFNPPRPVAPPTWSQYLAHRRAMRGAVVPVTRWLYPVTLVAALMIMALSVVALPSSSSLLPSTPQALWSHPGFVVGFLLIVAANLLALIAARSARGRSLRSGLHASLLLLLAGFAFVLGFVDTARRVALLNDDEAQMAGGVIAAAILGVLLLAAGVADLVQLPDLRRVPVLRFAIGYSWAAVLLPATMMLSDLKFDNSYAARISGFTTGSVDTAIAAVDAGRLGYASSGMDSVPVIIALALLLLAAIVTWFHPPQRVAHIPGALIAGPLVALSGLLVLLAVLQKLFVGSRIAGSIARELDISGSDIQLTIAYGGWILAMSAVLLLVGGTFALQAGLATPRFPPQRRHSNGESAAAHGPNAGHVAPAMPVMPPHFQPQIIHLPSEHDWRPSERPRGGSTATVLSAAQPVTAQSVTGQSVTERAVTEQSGTEQAVTEHTGTEQSCTQQSVAPEPEFGNSPAPITDTESNDDSSATGQYATFPTPPTQAPQ